MDASLLSVMMIGGLYLLILVLAAIVNLFTGNRPAAKRNDLNVRERGINNVDEP